MSLVRLQKYLAEAGLGSRRACESIIRAGRVSINGTVIRQLGTKVHSIRDRIAVDGLPVRLRRKLYVALHKPAGYLCSRTRQNPKSRLVEDLLPLEWRHLVSVGRLDAESEGLIFLSNDGQFTNRVSHPRYGVRKIYQVIVEGRIAPSVLGGVTRGIRDRGEPLRAAAAKLLACNNTRSILELTLTEGRNREIRRLLAAFGLSVLRLQRIQIGPIKLGGLPPGKWRTLTESEIESLLPHYEE